jgi:PTH1 family peptidyl-tRNA hydrolase
VSKYGVPLDDLCVVYDDIDLNLGILRIRRKGSAGGHKGIKSIISSLGSQSFPRMRIGIGQPPEEKDSIDYVLSRFSDQEREQIHQVEKLGIEALKVMILDGIDPAMNEFNVRQETGC